MVPFSVVFRSGQIVMISVTSLFDSVESPESRAPSLRHFGVGEYSRVSEPIE